MPAHKESSDCLGFLSIFAAFLTYNIHHLEVTVVVFWSYIKKIEFVIDVHSEMFIVTFEFTQ